MRARKRWGVVAATLATLFVVFLVASQLLLPSLAATRVRESLESTGTGVTATVEASPALKLLAGEADQVTIAAQTLSTEGGGGVSDLLKRARAATNVDASVGTMRVGPMTLRHVRFTKRGRRFTAHATLTDQALAGALPSGIAVAAQSVGHSSIDLMVTPEVLGLGATASATLAAEQGKLVVTSNLPVLDAVHLSIFEDPEVDVEGLSVRRGSGAYEVATRGSYR